MRCQGIVLSALLTCVSLIAQAAPIARPPLPNPFGGLNVEARGPAESRAHIATELVDTRDKACKGDCTGAADMDVREPTPCKGDCL
ncbi:hypothetical protein BD626DRAFT_562986 [Schizophyllum amplum]|uniref:Secreted protein n=1 Tax=Schizophyllum amplum TaxID=97359 RepID=A0A550CWP2_9AGAR|nr:hypothetical protein BD626DRAFT_562986 [Auriculariopsis ampla]